MLKGAQFPKAASKLASAKQAYFPTTGTAGTETFVMGHHPQKKPTTQMTVEPGQERIPGLKGGWRAVHPTHPHTHQESCPKAFLRPTAAHTAGL